MRARKGRELPFNKESTQHFLNGEGIKPSSPLEGESNSAQNRENRAISNLSRPIPINKIFMLIFAETVLSACAGGGGGNSTGRFKRTGLGLELVQRRNNRTDGRRGDRGVDTNTKHRTGNTILFNH